MNFDWLLQTFQPLIFIYRRGNLSIIIVDVNQFVGHCLIPLDPCLILFVQVKFCSVSIISNYFFMILTSSFFLLLKINNIELPNLLPHTDKAA